MLLTSDRGLRWYNMPLSPLSGSWLYNRYRLSRWEGVRRPVTEAFLEHVRPLQIQSHGGKGGAMGSGLLIQ